jgi:hypothetical protein
VITTTEDELVIVDVIDVLRNVLTYGFYAVFYILGIGIGLVVSFLDLNYGIFISNFIRYFFQNFLNLWFSFPEGSAPFLQDIPGLIMAEFLVLTTDVYLLMFQILFVVSIVYVIRAIYKDDPRYNLIAVGSLVTMIIVPLMVFGFRDMLDLFQMVDLFNNLLNIDLNALPNPINPELRELPLDDIFLFLVSPAALLTISSYVYLELSFQINYINNVTKPSLERSDRLEAQLSLLQRESHLITANVEKIKEEAQQRKEELKVEEKESILRFFTKATERFSYVKEMIERKKLEAEEKKLATAASKTRRLGRYIDRLFREIPDARDTITAKSAAPRSKNLLSSTLFNIFFRLSLLLVISYIVIHPQWFFRYVFSLPPAITESVAMHSPEILIILLLPVMLVFPVIAQIISYVKHRNLIIRLSQEGRIKEILASVGDYVKLDEEEGEETKETEVEEAVATETT